MSSADSHYGMFFRNLASVLQLDMLGGSAFIWDVFKVLYLHRIVAGHFRYSS